MSEAVAVSRAQTVRAQGYLICISATFAWAFTGIMIRYLTVNFQLPPLVLAFWRDVFVASALALVFLFTNRKRLILERRHLRFLVLYGLVLVLFNSLWTFSVALNGAAVSTVLAYSSSAFTALLAWWLLKESLHLPKIVAVSLALLGCIFVSGAYNLAEWAVNPFGILTGICSGMAFAAYSLMGKYTANRQINSWSALLYSFAFAGVFFLPLNLITTALQGEAALPTLFWLDKSALGWAVLIGLAVGPTIGGYGLYTLSLNYLPASVANLIAMLEPVITAVLAFFLLGEWMTPPQLFGGALIISSVVLIRIFESRQSLPETVAPA
jgi:drug/metabolite transporter (DMT)-like permease